jgi:phage baseplate assembly protein W
MNTNSNKTFGFPFGVGGSGRIAPGEGEDAIRGKIIQVLFTTPGERVNMPEFGCGLFNLVFEANNPVLAAAMEFNIRQALDRWLEDEIIVDDVSIHSHEETASIELSYTQRTNLSNQVLRVQFK